MGSCIFQMKKIFVINSIFLYRKLNPNSGLCHCFKSSVIALWNFPSFRVSQFVTSLEPPALTFYNLALFSIYVNDGTTISRSSVIINIKQILLRKGSRTKHVVENLKLRIMILFISNTWSCFFAKSLLYPHLEAR